ncbi:hypothetical protein MBANPS3_010535, partial [Mucor bainieri]
MYLDQMKSKHWNLDVALKKFKLKCVDESTARSKLIGALYKSYYNPNIKKACQTDCYKLLRKLDPERFSEENSSATTSATTSSSKALEAEASLAAPSTVSSAAPVYHQSSIANIGSIDNRQGELKIAHP